MSGLYAKKTKSIHYREGKIIFSKIEQNPKLKLIKRIVKESTLAAPVMVEREVGPVPQTQALNERKSQKLVKCSYTSLYNLLIPHKMFDFMMKGEPVHDVRNVSQSEEFGQNRKQIKILRLFNGVTMICTIKFNEVLKTNIFSGPLCILNEKEILYNAIIKTKVFEKANDDEESSDDRDDQFTVSSYMMEAEIFPAFFSHEHLLHIQYFECKDCLTAITDDDPRKPIP